MGCGHRYRPPSKVRAVGCRWKVIARLTTKAYTNPGDATVLARPEHGTAPGRQRRLNDEKRMSAPAPAGPCLEAIACALALARLGGRGAI